MAATAPPPSLLAQNTQMRFDFSISTDFSVTDYLSFIIGVWNFIPLVS